MRFFFLLQLLFLLVGCNSEYAELSPLRKTRIQVTPTLPAGITANKIMLWGKNSNGSAFARLIVQDQVSSFILLNGNYTLYSIAWTGANLTGDVYCSTTPTVFAGPDLPLNLNLTNDDCDVSHFRAAALSGTIPKTLGDLKVEWCESVRDITGSTHECTDDLSSGTRIQARGHAMSYRFVLSTFDKNRGSYSLGSDSISSGCFKGTPAVGSELKGLAEGMNSQLPAGDGSTTPFYISVETFPGSAGCDGTSHGVNSVTLENGLMSGSRQARYIPEGAISHKLYVRLSGEDVCTARAKTKTFAGGDGTRQSPYLICNENQFYNTQTTATSSFKLMADIDLSKYYYGINTLPNIPDGLSCLDKGSNFFPLGYNYLCNATAETFSTNDFDGGGKTLKGLRIQMPNNDFVGIFIKKNGGEIRRLKLQDIVIKGRSNVGVLSGNIETRFREIVGNNISVTGTGAFVGTLAGLNPFHPTACEFNNIRLNNTQVMATSSYVGGIIGQTSSCNFYNTSVVGHISTSANNAGGIAGNLANGIMDKVSFEGLVKGFSYVGGITGVVNEGMLTNSYAQGSVHATHTWIGVNLGGLVGATSGTVSVTNLVKFNYFFGQVDHSCVAPAASCAVSNIVGDPGTWGAINFTTNNYVSTNGVSGFTTIDVGASRPLASYFDTGASFPAAFSLSNTDLPRLSHETDAYVSDLRHPCRSVAYATETVATQISYGLGTSVNPIGICHFSQLKDMQASATHASKFYKLLSFVLATQELDPSTQTFTGQLDGDSKGIVRLSVKGIAGQDVAWWKTLAAGSVMKNLWIVDSRIIDSVSSAGTTALIAKTNYGELNAVHSLATRTSPGNVGEHSLYVHTNYGRIVNSFVGGSGTVREKVAAAMYYNYGTFEDSWVTTYLTCHAAFACQKITGVASENDGIIRRVEVSSNIIEQTMFGGDSHFAFISLKNQGLVEDIHIKTSKILSKAQRAHAIVIANHAQGIVRRVYNEGRVLVYNFGLPSLAPVTSADYMNGATSTVGYSAGVVSDIAYKYIPRWSYPSQVNNGPRTVTGASECTAELGSGMPAQWETNMTALFGRFGVMVTPEEFPFIFNRAPVYTAGNDFYAFNDPTPCSLVAGNPLLFFVPYDQFNENHLITQAQSLTFSTFSTWSGVDDITLDDSPIHQYQFDKLNGITSSKPVWIFDTTNSLRIYR